MTPSNDFPIETAGLAEAGSPHLFEVANENRFELRISPVAKRLGNALVRMLAYNGSVPGPILRVKQGSELEVNVLNEGDLDATVHWHGLRVKNRYDGTPETQQPIPVGGRFTYHLQFPDPGVYWYHPHIREDYGQEMGLYGNIIVVPTEPDYWPPVDGELTLTIDDLLLEDGKIAPFSRSGATYAAAGRFGNVFLINGDLEPSFPVRQGEVVRIYLTNTANTRVFNLRVRGARMKLVGGDSGRYEREEFVESVLLSSSERAVVDVLFDKPGQLTLEHLTPKRTYQLASFTVGEERVAPSLAKRFLNLRTNEDMLAERAHIASYLDAAPDKTLALVAEMNLTPSQPVDRGAHDEHHHGPPAGHHALGPGDIGWEDGMPNMNRMTTPANFRWKLVDRATGAEGTAIDWRFRVGDRVKIRLVNEMKSAHPMQHPIHIHGAGRFLILSRDGTAEPNLVWKDTVLVRTGQTVDILLDITNPGVWMVHCHISEHHESGMMFNFRVEP